MSQFEKLHGVVVGLGSIGNRHLQNLVQLGVGRLTVVRRATSQNQQFEVPDTVRMSHDLDETLATAPDFVVVCNPSHLHVETATKCLAAGCHVLIEKPLSADLGSDERRLQAFAEQSDRVAAMAYCMRYHPAYRRARELILAGAIGRVLYGKAWFEGFLPDWHPWEDYRTSYAALRGQSGGVLRTLDHELDFLNWALGPATDAIGWATNVGGIGIEADDLAMYQLRHAGGVCSQLLTSFCRKPASRGFEFVGDNGTLCFRMEEPKLLCSTHVSSAEATTVEDLTEYDINRMYFDLVQDFLNAVCGNTSTSIPRLTDGLKCATLFEQIDHEEVLE
ncbi:MAG: Gfo/Idh/MocA family oxidoreductase [Planctomycetota bacterium]